MRIMKNYITTLITLLLLGNWLDSIAQFTNNGNFQLHAGTTMAFFGDFVNDGTFTDSTNSVIFKGSSLQSIGGTANTILNNVEIENSSGVVLDMALTVKGILTITDGELNLNGKTLTINNPDSAAIIRTGGYILSENTNNSGKVQWNIGTDLTAHVFPFGTAAAEYIPFTFDLTSGDSGNVTVSTYPTAADNLPFPSGVTNLNNGGSDNSVNVVDRFFQIDLAGETSPVVTVTFTATNTEVGSIVDLVAQRWNGTLWEDPIIGQSNTATSVTVPNVTQFSPWALTASASPLPIELISLTATAHPNSIVLNWATASERNNERFDIYRSFDGKSFEKIGEVKGAGDSFQTLRYAFTDNYPYTGINYYRLRQVDYSGEASVSPVVSVYYDENVKYALFYPNPSNGSNLKMKLSGYKDTNLTVTISDLSGHVPLQKNYNPAYNEVVDDIRFNIIPEPGIYIVSIIGGSYRFTQKLVIR